MVSSFFFLLFFLLSGNVINVPLLFFFFQEIWTRTLRPLANFDLRFCSSRKGRFLGFFFFLLFPFLFFLANFVLLFFQVLVLCGSSQKVGVLFFLFFFGFLLILFANFVRPSHILGLRLFAAGSSRLFTMWLLP